MAGEAMRASAGTTVRQSAKAPRTAAKTTRAAADSSASPVARDSEPSGSEEEAAADGAGRTMATRAAWTKTPTR